ncbi:hypothetical protein PN466_02135 [Roseofilum reptotaenium CS-1145]|uniref:Uncharacterized protein n=1 Tax=Roseofilum reptotaenium AO1-A TaxID=1925591 RepID=A0A1L9QPN9_9CYAN|nr:hypothetical protein [Roseofilum reptotaenium]MDB9515756.1 hypothetical protein [Roseofilum reptotaenium CS-1145]OJJ24640.1 hypothetical protein BI308_15940 [Roseofilum reptotaenium AO1-A]
MQVNISSSWQEKIGKIASDRQKTSQEVVQEAIALYLGEVAANSGDRLVALEREVTLLKQTVNRLHTLVTVMRQQQLSAPSTQQTPISETVLMPEPDDDMDDEPDEILYDFLEPT